MSRYRLQPSPGQELKLAEHCRHARFVWNLAVEQHAYWRPGRSSAPSYSAQARELTEARAEFAWLRAGSVTVQQQALRDFAQAMAGYFARTHRRPTWRKAGIHEGFRQVAVKTEHVQRLNRKHGRVWIPKVGWVRFRWSRSTPQEAASYRVTRDRAGRWHIAFTAVPAPIPAPGTKSTVGIDRGVAVSAALSTGELLIAPRLTASEQNRVLRLQRRLARARRGSHRRSRLKNQLARLKMREADRRKNWIEHVSTSLAQRFDLVRVENLNVRVMSRSARGTHAEPGTSVRAKARLNHAILTAGWGLLVTRLKHKAPGRVENIAAAYTSQTCHACGYCARENRKSQAEFLCVACGNADHADVNAAKNIAVGRTVTARGDLQASAGSTKREPQLAPFSPLR